MLKIGLVDHELFCLIVYI